MKRRSKAGGEPIKRRRPKSPEATRRNAPKVEIRPKSSSVAEEKEAARLGRERDEALEQQTAASEVLGIISTSPGELEIVFQAMLERAVRLCEAKFGNIYRWDGETLHILASHKTPPAFAEAVRLSPYRPYPHSPIGRMVADKDCGSHSGRYNRGGLSRATRPDGRVGRCTRRHSDTPRRSIA